MPITDLNDPIQFAAAIAGEIEGFLDGAAPGEWSILEGTYNTARFLIFEIPSYYKASTDNIQDTIGRRKIKYKFPYVDGQTTDDLGRKPQTFTVNCLIYGASYKIALQQFILELNQPRPGILVHPVRGVMRVVPEDVTILHESKSRNAAALRIVFEEHNYDLGSFIGDLATFKSLIGEAVQTVQTLEEGVVAIAEAVIATSPKQLLTGLMNEFKSTFSNVLSRLNRLFNPGSENSTDIPGLLPLNQGSNAEGTFPTLGAPNDPFLAFRAQEVVAEQNLPLTVNQLQDEVNSARADIEEIINTMEAVPDGALIFHDQIVDLINSGIQLQQVFEKGKESSRFQVLDFITPRLMSLREVAFLNGLDVATGTLDLDQLNPELESVNFIPAGTLVKVPVNA